MSRNRLFGDDLFAVVVVGCLSSTMINDVKLLLIQIHLTWIQLWCSYCGFLTVIDINIVYQSESACLVSSGIWTTGKNTLIGT